jgi:hypothetical protein
VVHLLLSEGATHYYNPPEVDEFPVPVCQARYAELRLPAEFVCDSGISGLSNTRTISIV